ncbi:helix-turn-helix transcriptional regulator, partial [Heyndrickxia sporothermodurans]
TKIRLASLCIFYCTFMYFLLAKHTELAKQNGFERTDKYYYEKTVNQDEIEVLKFIARCMVQVFGYGPIEYLNRIRIEQSKAFLIYTDWSIERIAEQCGISQLSYYCRLFKKQVGITPNQYRKSKK